MPENNTTEKQTNASAFKRLWNKVIDKASADKTPDPDDLKPKKNYETKEYWESREKLPPAPNRGDVGIDR